MIDKRVKNIIEAVAGVKSGMTFMFGGFGLSGIPENAIAELSKREIQFSGILFRWQNWVKCAR